MASVRELGGHHEHYEKCFELRGHSDEVSVTLLRDLMHHFQGAGVAAQRGVPVQPSCSCYY
jgi:hypothetical protein